jgi:hypothetical protein
MLKICYVGGDSPELIFEGDVQAVQVKHAFDAVVSGPTFTPCQGLILDATGLRHEFSHEEIRTMAEHMAERRDELGHRLAVVVSAENKLQFGLARMFSVYAGMHDLTVAIFTRESDAVRFIVASAEA